MMVLLFLAVGCDPNFEPGSLLTKPRILAAKVQLEHDPYGSWPLPEEAMDITWLSVDPFHAPAFEWVFGACVPLPTFSGSQLCQSVPFGLSQGEGAMPRYALTAPDTATLGDANHILIAGIVCAHGELVFESDQSMGALAASPDVFRSLDELVQCRGPDAERLLVTLKVPIRTGAEQNHHPVLDGVPIYFDYQTWPVTESDFPGTTCTQEEKDRGAVLTSGKKSINIRLAFDGQEREFYHLLGAPGSSARELLQLSHLTTAGKFERQFSIVESTAPDDTAVDVKWILPQEEEGSQEPRRVMFYFIARDRRGGVGWAVRSICVPSVLE